MIALNARHRVALAAAAVTATIALLAGCSAPTTGAAPTDAPASPAAAPSLEFAGPNGEKPGPLSDLVLSADDVAKIKAGQFTAAFVWHTSGDFVAAVERGARAEFERLGIKVVASTQADFDAGTQANNIQTVMALKPSIVVAIAVDPTSAATSFKPIVDGGSKLVIMTTPPAGYTAGKEFVSIVTEDLAKAGKANAEVLGDALGGAGEIGVVGYNANFWFTNQRDKAFKDWIGSEYPKISIVEDAGFAKETETQTVAAALIAKHPNLKGIYVSWATAAQGVLAAIKASGRTDIQLVTNDIDTALAAAMNTGPGVAGMIGNGSVGIGTGLADAGAYGLLGRTAPALVASEPTKVTKKNLADGWKADYGTEPPASVTGK
ncbi:MAG: substrate-binding domain-containing protein [Actinobacteria bacterium]|nr:substrate-binding domain-containing protein [Actinomycetota bacterium]